MSELKAESNRVEYCQRKYNNDKELLTEKYGLVREARSTDILDMSLNIVEITSPPHNAPASRDIANVFCFPPTLVT